MIGFQDRVRSAKSPLVLLLTIAVLIVLPLVPPFNSAYVTTWLVYAAWFAALAVAFDFSAGTINVFNLGYAAFVGSGAYAAAILSVRTGLSPWLSMFFGLLVAGILGLGTGLLTLRFRGIYVALATWFLSLALMGLTSNLTELTRGSLGLVSPRLFLTVSNLPYYYTALAMLVVIYTILTLLTRSRLGLASRAIGQNPAAARASGISPARYRIANFSISCACAGWLGAFYAGFYGVLTPDIMAITMTIQVLAAVMVGGLGSLWGPAVGGFAIALVSQALQTNLQALPGLDSIIYGLVLILVIVLYPGGLARLLRRSAEGIRAQQAIGSAEPGSSEPVAGSASR